MRQKNRPLAEAVVAAADTAAVAVVAVAVAVAVVAVAGAAINHGRAQSPKNRLRLWLGPPYFLYVC